MWPSPSGITRVRHSSLIDRTNRSAYALRLGVLRKNLCRDRLQLVVMMQAAETRADDDTMRGR